MDRRHTAATDRSLHGGVSRGGGRARRRDRSGARRPSRAGEVERARDRPPPRRQRDDVGHPAAAGSSPKTNPVIIGYDQEEFARRLYYDRPLAASLAAFAAARASTAEILTRMSEAEWRRRGTHSESGAVQRRALARDLRRPRPQSRRSDSPGSRLGEAREPARPAG